MHEKGCYSPEAKATLRQLEKQVQELTEKLSDTLVIVTADHGHMNSRGVAIENYPKITECLETGPESGAEGCEFLREGREKAAV